MSGSISQGISSLVKNSTGEPYTARAPLKDGAIDSAQSSVTGNRKGGIFTERNDVNKEDFLTLLVTQMRYQDPLSPMDNTQFVTQLAQFRTLEGTNSMERTLKELKDSFQVNVDTQKYSAQSMTNAAAVSLIGKEVRLRETSVYHSGVAGKPVPIRVHLGNQAQAHVELLDNQGAVVRTMLATGKDAENSVELLWDGTTDAGTHAKAGSYTIRLVGEENNPALYAFVEDKVGGVRFSSQGALIKVGGKELSIGSLLDVSPEGKGSNEGITPAMAIGLLGKQVSVRQESISYRGRVLETPTFTVNAPGLPQVTVRLQDASGATVRSLIVPVNSDGTATVVWDGLHTDGETRALAGSYKIIIDEARTNPAVCAFTQGIVDGVSMVEGYPQIRINGTSVQASKILEIATVYSPQDGAV